VEIVILTIVAAFISAGVYLVLDRTLLRVIIGLSLLSNGTNLFLLSTGGLEGNVAPILGSTSHEAAKLSAHTASAVMADPLPQALILTAIVIGFAVTAMLLVLAYRSEQSYDSDDLLELHGRLHDE